MECSGCGSAMRDEARVCLACGEIVRRKVAASDRLEAVPAGVPNWIAFEARPPADIPMGAGRPARMIAALVDAVIVGVGVWLISAVAGPAVQVTDDWEYTVNWWLLIPLLVPQCAYYVVFPATKWQGTPGKRLLGLRITDMSDDPITIFQSVMRYVLQQVWLWVGVPLTLIGVSNSPWAALLPFVAVIAVGVAFWMLCANGRSPWDWMAGTRVVE